MMVALKVEMRVAVWDEKPVDMMAATMVELLGKQSVDLKASKMAV